MWNKPNQILKIVKLSIYYKFLFFLDLIFLLEHEIFTVCKQLDEKSEKLKEVQQQNALLKERASTLGLFFKHKYVEKSCLCVVFLL